MNSMGMNDASFESRWCSIIGRRIEVRHEKWRISFEKSLY
jgi:hypothetical protein